MCITCIPGVQKRSLDSLELEIPMVVSSNFGAGN